jgi:hypothetical protein
LENSHLEDLEKDEKDLRKIYFAYFHSIMSYGLIFWVTSSYSSSIVRLQKKVIRIMTNSRKRDSCREMFKGLEILPLYSKFIFSLLIFVSDHSELFKTNLDLHSINTKIKNNFHFLQPRLCIYQKGVYYMGIIIFNQLPSFLKGMVGKKKLFKSSLKWYLLENSFYSFQDFFLTINKMGYLIPFGNCDNYIHSIV